MENDKGLYPSIWDLRVHTLKILQVTDNIPGQFKIQMLLYKYLPYNVVQWGWILNLTNFLHPFYNGKASGFYCFRLLSFAPRELHR